MKHLSRLSKNFLVSFLCSVFVLSSGQVFAWTACHACLDNRYSSSACQSSYFLSDCVSGGGSWAYYRSTSATQWLSKCSDGTILLNTDCKNTFQKKDAAGNVIATVNNACKLSCATF